MMRDEYLKQISEAYAIDRGLPSDKVGDLYKLLVQFREQLKQDNDLYYYLCDVKKHSLYEYLYTYLDIMILYEGKVFGYVSTLLNDLGNLLIGVVFTWIPRAALRALSTVISRVAGSISQAAKALSHASGMWAMHEAVIYNNAASCYKRCGINSPNDIPKFLMMVRQPTYVPSSMFESVRKTLPCLVDCYCNLVLDTISILAQELFVCVKNSASAANTDRIRSDFRTIDDVHSIVTVLRGIPECSVYSKPLINLVESYLLFVQQYYRSVEWPDLSDETRMEIKRKYNESLAKLVVAISDAYSAASSGSTRVPQQQRFPRGEERKNISPDKNIE